MGNLDLTRNLLSLLGLDEQLILYGKINLPDQSIVNIIKAAKKEETRVLHSDLTDTPDNLRESYGNTLRDINHFAGEIDTVEKWQKYKKGRRGYLQSSGEIPTEEITYARRIEELKLNLKGLEDRIETKEEEIKNLRSKLRSNNSDALAERLKEEERKITSYRADLTVLRLENSTLKENYNKETKKTKTLERELEEKNVELKAADLMVRSYVVRNGELINELKITYCLIARSKLDNGDFLAAKEYAEKVIELEEGIAEAHFIAASAQLKLDWRTDPHYITRNLWKAETRDSSYIEKAKPLRLELDKLLWK